MSSNKNQELQITAYVLRGDHRKLRCLLVAEKLNPHKNFSEWLRAKEAEEVSKERKKS
jgi:hypothetical protein